MYLRTETHSSSSNRLSIDNPPRPRGEIVCVGGGEDTSRAISFKAFNTKGVRHKHSPVDNLVHTCCALILKRLLSSM